MAVNLLGHLEAESRDQFLLPVSPIACFEGPLEKQR